MQETQEMQIWSLYPEDRASLIAQLVKNLLQWGRPEFDPLVGKISWRWERLPTPVFWPGEFHGLQSMLQIVGHDPGVGNGTPFQYSCLENSMDRGAWLAVVHGVSKSQTQLSDWAHTHTEQCKARAETGTHLWKWQSRVREARFQKWFYYKARSWL